MQSATTNVLMPRSSKSNYEIQKTTADLERQKKIYNSVSLSMLPDKGAKIKNKIDELENLLKDLTIEAAECTKTHSSSEENIQNSETSSDKPLLKSVSSSDKDIETNALKSSNNSKSNSSATVKDTKSKSTSLVTHLNKASDNNSSLNNSNKTLKILSSHAAEGFTSFQELSKQADKNEPDPLKALMQSPAFKTYRKAEIIPSKTKPTEAKPLFHVASLTTDETINQLHSSLAIFPNNYEDEKQPKYLKVSLMKHQIKALSWLMWREAQTPSGGILADDMGLGKTLTMIALILKQREKRLANGSKEKTEDYFTKGTLVVCLASIIHQWESEIKKHTEENSVNVLVYHGPQREKNINHIKKFDVVVTTYQIVLSEKKAAKSGLFELKWERIILDEAHTIKNHSSKTAEAVFSLGGFKKWCVTGTPIHNDFKDMYSLVKFLQFHPFDDFKKFKKLTDDKTDDYDERRNMLVRSILLRRTKMESDEDGKPLIKMVKKNISITYIDLSLEERKVYDDLNKKITDIVRRVLDNSVKKFNNTSSLLVLLLRVQQCCCHISLLNQEAEETVDDSLSDVLSKSLASLKITDASNSSCSSDSNLDVTFSEYESHSMCDETVMSSKLLKLFEELDKIAEDSNNSAKTVIVSQWVSMLKLVEYHLKKKNKVYHMIIGSTKSEERQSMAEKFNFNCDGPKIMLLSLKAGGVGLNLVGANHMFLLDLHWNPALEMQACDRIHRVGQKNDVFIHKFVCKNTIEEKILALQKEKNNMALNALNGAKKVKKGLSIDDLKMLFNVRF